MTIPRVRSGPHAKPYALQRHVSFWLRWEKVASNRRESNKGINGTGAFFYQPTVLRDRDRRDDAIRKPDALDLSLGFHTAVGADHAHYFGRTGGAFGVGAVGNHFNLVQFLASCGFGNHQNKGMNSLADQRLAFFTVFRRIDEQNLVDFEKLDKFRCEGPTGNRRQMAS